MMSKRVKSPPTLDESDKVSTTFDIVTYYLVEVKKNLIFFRSKKTKPTTQKPQYPQSNIEPKHNCKIWV